MTLGKHYFLFLSQIFVKLMQHVLPEVPWLLEASSTALMNRQFAIRSWKQREER
jgi:hypothetical protein